MSRRRAGFTLPELLIVLAILACLLAAGVPGLHSYLQNQQVATAANQLLFALNLARSEAMQRGGRVDVVPHDGQRWESGWVVFVNQGKGGSGNPQFDAGDQLIYRHQGLVSRLVVSTTLSDKSYPYIAYNGNGRTRTNLSPLSPQWGSWQFSLNGKERIVRVTLAGRARLCNPADDPSCRFGGAGATP